MTITITKWKLAVAVVAIVLIAPATVLADHVFDDVDDSRFFAEPVEWASDNGITTGTSPTTFDPDRGVTRGESVTFLKRYDDNIVQPTVGNLQAADAALGAADADRYTKAEMDAALFRRQVFVGDVDSSGTKKGPGPFTMSHPAAGRYIISFDLTGAGLPEALGPMRIVASPGITCHGDSSAHAGWTGSATDADGFLTIATLEVHTTLSGVQTDCDFSFIATFAGSDELILP